MIMNVNLGYCIAALQNDSDCRGAFCRLKICNGVAAQTVIRRWITFEV